MPNIFIGGCMPARNMNTQLNYTQLGILNIYNNNDTLQIPITNEAVGSPLRIIHNGNIRCIKLVNEGDSDASKFKIQYNYNIHACAKTLVVIPNEGDD